MINCNCMKGKEKLHFCNLTKNSRIKISFTVRNSKYFSTIPNQEQGLNKQNKD